MERGGKKVKQKGNERGRGSRQAGVISAVRVPYFQLLCRIYTRALFCFCRGVVESELGVPAGAEP